MLVTNGDNRLLVTWSACITAVISFLLFYKFLQILRTGLYRVFYIFNVCIALDIKNNLLAWCAVTYKNCKIRNFSSHLLVHMRVRNQHPIDPKG